MRDVARVFSLQEPNIRRIASHKAKELFAVMLFFGIGIDMIGRNGEPFAM